VDGRNDGTADVFNYDGVYRLTDVKYSVPNSAIGDWNNTANIPFEQLVGTRTVEYNMDGVGNRTSVVDDGKVTTYATNSVNEYVYVDNQRLMYDRNGNMTSDSNLQMFYDHNNMLVEIRTGQYVFHQRFDAIGRRLMVQFSDGLTETRYFWHDGQQVVYEEVSGLTEPYKYVWGNGIDEALLRFGNGDIWYLDNQLGSVMALTDNDGQIVESYRYDECSICKRCARPRGIRVTDHGEIRFRIDHIGIPVGRSRESHIGYYNLILPQNFRFTDIRIVDPHDRSVRDICRKKQFEYTVVWDAERRIQLVEMEIRSNRGTFSFVALGSAVPIDAPGKYTFVESKEYDLGEMPHTKFPVCWLGNEGMEFLRRHIAKELQ